jgi:hypothetical protein
MCPLLASCDVETRLSGMIVTMESGSDGTTMGITATSTLLAMSCNNFELDHRVTEGSGNQRGVSEAPTRRKSI